MPKLIFLWHFNFSLLSFILFKYTLNKLSLPSKIYIFSVFIFCQTVTLTTHNPTQTHQPRTNSSNPANQERNQQTLRPKYKPIELRMNPATLHPKSNTNPTTTQIGLNPQYKSAETQPNKSANLPKSQIQTPTQIS